MNRLGLVSVLVVFSACGGRADSPSGSGGVPPAPQPSPGATADDDNDVAAVLLADGLRFVSHDGGVRTALSGDPILNGVTGAYLQASGGFVLAVLNDDTHADQRAVLLTSDGNVLWRHTYPDPTWADHAGLGRDGSFYRSDPLGTTVLRADGSTAELAGFEPAGAATADSFLPVGPTPTKLQAENYHAQASDYGWWKIGDAAPSPLAFAPAQAPLIFGRTIVYARADAPDASLVIQSPEAVHAFALPDAVLTDVEQVDPLLGRWIVVRDSDPSADAVWRIDLTSGQAERHALSVPAGFRPMGSCVPPQHASDVVSATPDGNLIAILRTDDRAALFESADGAAWSMLGEPVTGVGSVRARFVGATFLLLASTEVPCYTPGPKWTATTTPALLPEATQALRPARGSALVKTGTAADGPFGAPFSSSGRYAADWGTSDDAGARALHVVDVENGTDIAPIVDTTGRAAGPVWVTTQGAH